MAEIEVDPDRYPFVDEEFLKRYPTEQDPVTGELKLTEEGKARAGDALMARFKSAAMDVLPNRRFDHEDARAWYANLGNVVRAEFDPTEEVMAAGLRTDSKIQTEEHGFLVAYVFDGDELNDTIARVRHEVLQIAPNSIAETKRASTLNPTILPVAKYVYPEGAVEPSTNEMIVDGVQEILPKLGKVRLYFGNYTMNNEHMVAIGMPVTEGTFEPFRGGTALSLRFYDNMDFVALSARSFGVTLDRSTSMNLPAATFKREGSPAEWANIYTQLPKLPQIGGVPAEKLAVGRYRYDEHGLSFEYETHNLGTTIGSYLETDRPDDH